MVNARGLRTHERYEASVKMKSETTGKTNAEVAFFYKFFTLNLPFYMKTERVTFVLTWVKT